jgi:Na+-transporting methylmalonyl-CoA/oxaloacetate decarboxylase gamma subunit
LKAVGKSLSVSALANATAAQITIKKVVLAYSSPSPTLRPTSQPSTPHSATRNEKNPSALSEGGLIGVIGAAVVIFFLLALALFICHWKTKKVGPRIIPIATRPTVPEFSHVGEAVVRSDVHAL